MTTVNINDVFLYDYAVIGSDGLTPRMYGVVIAGRWAAVPLAQLAAYLFRDWRNA